MQAESPAAAYAAMVAEAEKAVASVKDPELKRVAFEKILGTLLEQKTPLARGARPRRGGRTAPVPAKGASRPTKKRAGGPTAYIQELIDEGFFKKQHTIADVKAELANRGHHIALTSLSGPLQSLTQKKRLRRQKAVAKGKKSKGTYAYSNW